MRNIKSNDQISANREEKYQSADINDRLIINLRDLNHIMRSLYEGKGSQKRILIVLKEASSITQRELTERLGIKPGSASEVIAKLENAGLISRTPSSVDRRTSDVALTEKGRELAEQACQQRHSRHEEMFSCLTEDEKANLLSLLEKINTDWNDRYVNDDKMNDRHAHHHGHGPHRKPHGRHKGFHLS